MNNQNNYQIAYDAMPEVFSSVQYCRKLRSLGTTQKEIETDKYQIYLNQHTQKVSKRTYIKNTAPKKQSVVQMKIHDNFNDYPDFVKAGIDWLKQHGFKILKPITEFKEL